MPGPVERPECGGNFYGGVDGTSSTFYGNDTGLQGGSVGDFVRVRLSNILGSRKEASGTRGGKGLFSGNYWGKEGPGDPAATMCAAP